MTVTADLYDEHGEALASLSVQLRDFGGVTCLLGPGAHRARATRTTAWSRR